MKTSKQNPPTLETTSNIFTPLNDKWKLCIIDVYEKNGAEVNHRFTKKAIQLFHKHIKEIYDSFGLPNVGDILFGEQEIVGRDFDPVTKVITISILI